MSQWKNIGPVVALSITAALAGTGCLAQGADDEEMPADDTAAVAADESSAVVDRKERTGEADQAWFGGFTCGFPFAGFGGFAGCGIGVGPFLGGVGFGLGGFGPFGCGGCW